MEDGREGRALRASVCCGHWVFTSPGNDPQDQFWSQANDLFHAVSHGSPAAGNNGHIAPESEQASASHGGPTNDYPETAAQQPAPKSPSKAANTQSFTRPLEALAGWHGLPDLPPGLKAKGPVSTKLLLSVAANGSVSDASVVEFTGLAWLDRQAIDWVKAHWRYRPALRGNRPVEAATTAIVFFNEKKRGRTPRNVI